MWPDNETDVDLLGFDYLVDQLEVVLTNERLLPLTVLLSGDYGSGKSSLMEVASKRLQSDDNKGKFICVTFTPWRFEDFNYGKVALMTAVVDAIADYADEHTSVLNETAKLANRLRKTLHRWGAWKLAASGVAGALGADPQAMAMAAAGADVLGAESEDDEEPTRAFESVAHFHIEFEELIDSLGDKVQAVVVFIDDMDRCSSTETIVETFEAMRLFLHAPKTAYVVGAYAPVVEAALDSRYVGRSPDGDDDDASFGSRWLEKMLQNTVAVPPLGEPEVMSYINLLFAELYTSEADFAKLRAKAQENRNSNPFQVAMNAGIAAGTIGQLSPAFDEALGIATQVGPLLAQNLRGNPRQTKRFLNQFLMRMDTANKRTMNLDAATLAKLMVLEQLLDKQHFEQVFKWQLAADTGAPKELGLAERVARGEKPRSAPSEVTEWVAQPKVAKWLRLEPSLATVNLAPYFTFSRDRLATLVTAPRLSVELQRLLGALQNDKVDPQRVKAVNDALALTDDERTELLPALLDAAEKNLNGAASKSLRGLAIQRPDIATAMFDMLSRLPVSRVKGSFVLDIGTYFKKDDRTKPLLEKWADKGAADVKRQANRVLEKF